MFDDMAMYELLALMEELFYRPEQSQENRDKMEELAAEIMARVANSSI